MPRTTIFKICESCGASYSIDIWASRKRRFCSRACYGRWMTGPNNPFFGKRHTDETRSILRQFRDKKRGIHDPSWRGGPKSFICQYCGKEFRRHAGNKHCFCSRACMNACPSIHKRGAESSRWRGGTTPQELLRIRGREWKEMRRHILARDNYTCQRCGGKPRRLAVHHIVPYRYCFCDEEINLITMCCKCHAREEAEYPEKYPEEYALVNQWRAIVMAYPELVEDKRLFFGPALAPIGEQQEFEFPGA